MTQTIAIILRFREEEAGNFERLFQVHIFPMWKQFEAAGKFIGASVSPVVDGSEMEGGIREYILHVEVPSEKEHDEFDTQPAFQSFLDIVKPMQTGEPRVWIGETRFQV